ncbi:hypothetical protein ACIBIZ_45270 [Nonomuraea spiralis]|uniref:hypothetical protein n=1 Tax=Nonomuraea TaxID=83681 RepID=UPI000F7A28CC|nr:hypothetical protein [Nonomuraea sp. WAC 01424]RSN08379.1 hypothetical protein DMB42_20275 [Nonomuraea sp. WAC 01424]
MDGRAAGDGSRAQLVSTLEAAASTAREQHALPHLAVLCQRLAEALRRRWPDADIDLTTLEPYTPRLP